MNVQLIWKSIAVLLVVVLVANLLGFVAGIITMSQFWIIIIVAFLLLQIVKSQVNPQS